VSNLEKFRKKYEYINQETLEKASRECPELVEGIANDETVSALTRSHALQALADTENRVYIKLLKSYIDHDSALLRESARRGLKKFYKYKEMEKVADGLRCRRCGRYYFAMTSKEFMKSVLKGSGETPENNRACACGSRDFEKVDEVPAYKTIQPIVID
jgi:hypothetical protein